MDVIVILYHTAGSVLPRAYRRMREHVTATIACVSIKIQTTVTLSVSIYNANQTAAVTIISRCLSYIPSPLYVLVTWWFRMFYEAAQPRVELKPPSN